MKELNTIDGLLEEIAYLRNRSRLLDEILKFYDRDKMTFVIPEKWKDIHHLLPDKRHQIPKTPRHSLMKKMNELLPYSDSESLVDWDKIGETL